MIAAIRSITVTHVAEPLARWSSGDDVDITNFEVEGAEDISPTGEGQIEVQMGGVWKIQCMSRKCPLIIVDTRDNVEAGSSRTKAHAAAAAEEVNQFRDETLLFHYALIYATGFAES